jgi:hypothetical protein
MTLGTKGKTSVTGKGFCPFREENLKKTLMILQEEHKI